VSAEDSRRSENEVEDLLAHFGVGTADGAVAEASESHPEGERLQKVLAAAGVASRRVCEEYIVAGRVKVNGEVRRELGTRIHPETDQVEVDGRPIQLDNSRIYVMLNKPLGVVSTLSDEEGRPDLRQFTERYGARLFNVGRLDAETSGLLLLTNDGALAHTLAHPSFGVEKTYLATVAGLVSPATIRRLLEGIELEDGPIAADKARIVDQKAGNRPSTIVEVTLHSGRNRIVRRMFDAVGHPVTALVRRRFGPLTLGPLAVGATRELTKKELGALLSVARGGTPERSAVAGPTARGGSKWGAAAASDAAPKRPAAKGQKSATKSGGGKPSTGKSITGKSGGGKSGTSRPGHRPGGARGR